MPPSLRERRGSCFFGESITAGFAKKKEMRIVDFLKEGDGDEMIKKKIGSSSSLPSSPRSILSRWIASLTPRCGLSSAILKDKREELLWTDGDGSKVVVGSLTRVAPDNEGLQLELGGDGCGQLDSGKGECAGLKGSRCGKNVESGNQSHLGLIDGEEDDLSVNLEEGCLSKESVSNELKESGSRQDLTGNTSACSTSKQTAVSSGRCIEDASFSLGVGAGLVFLIAKSRNEFNKMIELQTQIETLLNDIKDEMRKKDMNYHPSETNTILVYSAPDSHGVERMDEHLSIQNHGSSIHLRGGHSAVECVQSPNFSSTTESEKYVGMDQLEAELEAELERLQLNLDGEDLSGLGQHQYIEMIVENAAPARIFTQRFEEDDEPQEFHGNNVCYGVSPNELEKRLHEVLETRQQERIEELESALEYAERKLREKEMEIRWWKDNVHFLLQEKTGSSRMPFG
ncbi:protein POLAR LOCALIZATION DURING ASYMMETRIC DIVISION AND REDISTRIBUTION-like isoform X2 [Magnolia sinica]|nr:protein POLAR LOCALIZATION DURING ASYMMETRIC DIVISION AND REDISTRIBUTION-like isoform X2 [Magnolia sinica]